MRVILECEKGSKLGKKYELTMRAYRAVGRAGRDDVTVQVSREGDLQLDPDDLARVEQHLARREPDRSASGTGSLRLGGFRRGRDILLDDDKISRTHAMFFLDEEGPSVVDLLSTNGTHVNGAKVSDAELKHGDVVNVGKTRFVVWIEADHVAGAHAAELD